jgi:8-oxo-dGTP diphosphatase
MSSDKIRSSTRIAAYMVGFREDSVLLGKRKNVSHMDGYWSLVAGHVYEHESAAKAMLREAYEECALILNPKDLQLAGVMHHNSPPFDYVNFIYKVDLSNKQIQNKEAHKCDELKFFSIHHLPNPIADYIQQIIHASFFSKIPWISECGWGTSSHTEN